MAYIGNSVESAVSTPATDFFNGDGVTTTFTLSRNVQSFNDFTAYVNNVPQNPVSAYSISGPNQITFTGAPSAGTNNVYVRYIGKNLTTIAIGQGTIGTDQLGSVSRINSIGSDLNLQINGTNILSLSQTNVSKFNSTSAIILPSGTTAQRPTAVDAAQLRFNSTIGLMEYFDGALWQTVGFKPISATGGTVTQSVINGITYNVHTFNYTGANQTFNVTNFGTSGIITVYMWGAAGGGASGEGYTDPGGAGGYSEGKINLLSNNFSSLIVQVGQGGTYGRGARPYPAGGLPAVRSSYVSGAGGGRSAIFNSSVAAGNALIIAGGGGGGAGHGGGATNRGSQGGAGGGTTGEGGYSSYQATTYNGATQTAPGTQSSRSYSGLGSGQLQGGDAGDGTAWSTGWNQTGGGGDGWYGGGAVDGIHQGGGGGSGYVHPTYVTSGVLQANFSNSNAAYLGPLNPPQTTNVFYSSGIGVGNNNAAGGNGKVVIIYPLTQTF